MLVESGVEVVVDLVGRVRGRVVKGKEGITPPLVRDRTLLGQVPS